MADAAHNEMGTALTVGVATVGTIFTTLGIQSALKDAWPKIIDWALKKAESEDAKRGQQSADLQATLNKWLEQANAEKEEIRKQAALDMENIRLQLIDRDKMIEKMREREDDSRKAQDEERKQQSAKILELSTLASEMAKELEFLHQRQDKIISDKPLDIAQSAVAAANLLQNHGSVMPVIPSPEPPDVPA